MPALDDIYEFYRQPTFANFGGPAMIRLLDAVGDLLRSKVLHFSTSHTKLWISRFDSYSESREHPAVGISVDDPMYEIDYQESWTDGPFYRRREDVIRCELPHAKQAIQELLSRLKPATAQ